MAKDTKQLGAKPKQSDATTLPVGSTETQLTVSTALATLDTGIPTGFALVRQGQDVTRHDGTVGKASATTFKLKKADTFNGDDDQAKGAARKQAGLDAKTAFAPTVTAVNGNASFILTGVRIREAKKSKARTIVPTYQEIRTLTLADMLATEKGNTPEYWQKVIAGASDEVPAPTMQGFKRVTL